MNIRNIQKFWELHAKKVRIQTISKFQIGQKCMSWTWMKYRHNLYEKREIFCHHFLFSCTINCSGHFILHVTHHENTNDSILSYIYSHDTDRKGEDDFPFSSFLGSEKFNLNQILKRFTFLLGSEEGSNFLSSSSWLSLCANISEQNRIKSTERF